MRRRRVAIAAATAAVMMGAIVACSERRRWAGGEPSWNAPLRVDGACRRRTWRRPADARGNTIFVWGRGPDRVVGGARRIMARARSAEGVWSPVVAVSGRGTFARAKLAVAAPGNALVAGMVALRARRSSRLAAHGERRLGRLFDVTPGRERASLSSCAVAGDGSAIFTWSDGSGRLRARLRSAGGRLGSILSVARGGSGRSVALGGGEWLVVWQASGGSRSHRSRV